MHPHDVPWWKRGTIYQIYPRSFQDSNDDGEGDLAGIISRLDYLAWLGIDAIWVSPFYPSPMADGGYDVANYRDVDPRFGDLATFDALLEAAHAREIAVVIDIVPNHTSDEHPWFIESRSSRVSAKRDWYVWRDPKPDGSPPNNWIRVWGGPSWTFDEKTGQYYLHLFHAKQPDLNWRHPDVKKAMFDVFRFWLARGVDGFRIDVAHGIMKDPHLRDNPPAGGVPRLLHRDFGAYDTQLHVHDRGHPDLHAVYRELRRILDEYSRDRPRMAVGEIHEFDWERWARYYGLELDELHMPFNFGLLSAKWNGPSVRGVVDAVERAIPVGAWPNWVLGNHDEPRIASRLGGEAQARVAMMLLLTLRGTPTLYYGDELGMRDVPIPPERVQDPWALSNPDHPELNRDPARTPMRWSGAENAGFTGPRVQPWLPVGEIGSTHVEGQRDDPRSMLSLTRALLAARRGSPALSSGTYRALDGLPPTCFAYVRTSANDRRVVLLSLSHEPLDLVHDALLRGRLELSTHLDREREHVERWVRLRPHEGVLIDPTAA
jgi:alpha-glucosidase